MSDSTVCVELAPTPAAQRRDGWLERAFLLALLLGLTVALARNTADADLWGHILFGIETIAAGHPLLTASHTYTAVDYPWINHENLSEVSLAVIHHYGGGTGLLAAKTLLGLLLMGSMIWVARRSGVSVVAICLVMLTVAFNLSPGWTLRPQLLTYTCLAAMVLILNAAFAQWNSAGQIRWRYLWLLLPLMVVWTNSHGGFVAGEALLALYLAVRIVEAGVRMKRECAATVARLVLVGLCAALMTLITPYGPLLHSWLIEDLGVPRPEIAEWAPLTLDSCALWPAVLMFALCGVSFTLTNRRRDWAEILLIVAAAGQSVEHGRHLPLMAILVGYWIPPYLESVCASFRRAATAGAPPMKSLGESRRTSWALMAVVLLGCAFLASQLVARCRQLWVDRTEFPVAAVEYMAAHHASGKLVATFNWAEYLLTALPQTTTNFDGRCRTCFPQSLHDMHFDFVLGADPRLRWRSPNSPRVEGDTVLKFGQPDLVLLDRRQPPSVAAMLNQPDWVLLYQDEIAQVWGRRTRFDDPKSLDYIAPNDRVIGNAPQEGFVAWPAIPTTRDAGRRVSGQFPPLTLPKHRGST